VVPPELWSGDGCRLPDEAVVLPGSLYDHLPKHQHDNKEQEG